MLVEIGIRDVLAEHLDFSSFCFIQPRRLLGLAINCWAFHVVKNGLTSLGDSIIYCPTRLASVEFVFVVVSKALLILARRLSHDN